jgi:hypothetical protein
MDPIRFYGKDAPYGALSNFAPGIIKIDKIAWPSAEHYFQAAKFKATDPAWADAIRVSFTPGQAAKMGRDRNHPLRSDWETVKEDVMRVALLRKFMQHTEYAKVLAETGDAPLIEASPTDFYWGEGSDGTGKNRIGTLLMEIRPLVQAWLANPLAWEYVEALWNYEYAARKRLGG